MKNIRIALLGAALSCMVLSGCSGTQPESAEGGREKESIVIWSYYETEAQQKALDQLVENFNLFQNAYEAKWEYVPMTEFDKKLAMAYTEQNLPDIALIDNPGMPTNIQMGMFEDLTEFLQGLGMEEEYYPSILKTVQVDGRLYGLPALCNNLVLVYNKEYLAEAGIEPPKTWEELELAAGKLTTEGRRGFLMSGDKGEQGAFQILPWILSTGEDIDRIGGEGTVKAFAFLQGLVEKGYMTSNCINYSQTDVGRVFIRGETAMMENGPWVFPMLDEAGIDYGVCALPIDKKSGVTVGGEVFGVLKGKNVEGAKSFLAYYNQDSVLTWFCEETGALPAKMNVSLDARPEMQVIREQMDGILARTEIPSWNSLSDDIRTAFYQIIVEDKTPEQAALDIQAGKK